MRVLFLTNIPSPYRVEFFNELGKTVELVVLFEKNMSEERDQAWQNYTFSTFRGIIMSGKKTSAGTALCLEVCKYLKMKWDHIIVSNVSTPTGMVAIQYMKVHHIPYWIEGDGAFAKSGKGIKETIKKYFHKGAVGYFSTGREHDKYYLTYGAEPSRIVRYPFSSVSQKDIIDNPLSDDEKRKIRESLEIPEANVILSVGQFIYRKGFDVLLKAAAELEDNVGVYFVGGVPTEEYLQLVKSRKLTNVHFIGFKNKVELKKYYLAADVLVPPTREDIWGLVINEAMACALPIITTNRCAAGLELVRNGENGYIIPVEDIRATSDAIQKVLSSDRATMGKVSLSIIREYTIEKMAEKHIQVLGE